MGGVLLIRKGPAKAVWLPQSWTYDALLESAAGELGGDLAQRLLAARLEVFGGYLAIDDLDADRFESFTGAVRHALENTQGGSRRAAFAELLALLRTDPRAREGEATGTIVIDDEHRWSAPRWLCDFVAAHLGLDSHEGVLDVRNRAAELLPEVRWMFERYGDAVGRGGNAPPVYAQIAAGVNALYDALRHSG